MNRPYTTVTVAVVLCAAITLKVVRYSDPPAPLEHRAEQAVAAMLLNHGWAQAGWRSLTTDGALRTAVFSHTDCTAPLTVAVITTGAEAESLVKRSLGPATAFLSPPGDFPVLAIVAPPAAAGTCRPPVEADWLGLTAPAAARGLAGWLNARLSALFPDNNPRSP